MCPDEDDETERNTVPLTALASFFSDDDSLKQQKKTKPKKIKEGKIPKVKKRKKEVGSCSHTALSVITSNTKVCQNFWLKLCGPHSLILTLLHFWCFCNWIRALLWLLDCLCNRNEKQWTVSGLGEVGSRLSVTASIICGCQVPVQSVDLCLWCWCLRQGLWGQRDSVLARLASVCLELSLRWSDSRRG